MDERVSKMWYKHIMEYYSAFKKEGNSDTCYSKDKAEPWGHYVKWNKQSLQIKYDFLYIQFLE